MAEAVAGPTHTWKSGVEAIAWNASVKVTELDMDDALGEAVGQLRNILPSLKIAERRLTYYNAACTLLFATGLALAAKATKPLWQKGALVANQTNLAYASAGSFALFAVAAKLRAPVKEARDIMHAIVHDGPRYALSIEMLEDKDTAKAMSKSWGLVGSIHSRSQHLADALIRAIKFAGLEEPEEQDQGKDAVSL